MDLCIELSFNQDHFAHNLLDLSRFTRVTSLTIAWPAQSFPLNPHKGHDVTTFKSYLGLLVKQQGIFSHVERLHIAPNFPQVAMKELIHWLGRFRLAAACLS
jgi:hypothetical protein